MKNLNPNFKLFFIPVFITVFLYSELVFSQGNSYGNATPTWNEITNQAPWTARAGLQVVNLNNDFILMGGRTPLNPAVAGFPGASIIWNDVWKSTDQGQSWFPLVPPNTPGHWPERAYFQAVKKNGEIFVMGGQNFQLVPNPDPFGPPFISQSVFYNDVWSSSDGLNWTEKTDSAKWSGRAGLSAIVFKGEIYVMGGSFNDDPAVIGGPPTRVYFNDVYKSSDGTNWVCLTDSTPWAPRAGAALYVKNNKLYLFGGEDGFTCIPGLRCPPYYNDVWSTRDGIKWKLEKEEAAWPSRPGHRVEKLNNKFVLFGGFGLSTDPTDPFKPSNPMDMWTSSNGKKWKLISNMPWNTNGPEDIKYDFASLVANGGPYSNGPTIYTFGGDRETFDFSDTLNYLNIDNDVWSFHLQKGNKRVLANHVESITKQKQILTVGPNPFSEYTTLYVKLDVACKVNISIYNLMGSIVNTLHNNQIKEGVHSFSWNGIDSNGNLLPSGVYFIKLNTGTQTQTEKVLLFR